MNRKQVFLVVYNFPRKPVDVPQTCTSLSLSTLGTTLPLPYQQILIDNSWEDNVTSEKYKFKSATLYTVLSILWTDYVVETGWLARSRC